MHSSKRGPAANASLNPTASLLADLEFRHNDVLEELDDLDQRVEQALADARRQFQADGNPDLAAQRSSESDATECRLDRRTLKFAHCGFRPLPNPSHPGGVFLRWYNAPDDRFLHRIGNVLSQIAIVVGLLGISSRPGTARRIFCAFPRALSRIPFSPAGCSPSSSPPLW